MSTSMINRQSTVALLVVVVVLTLSIIITPTSAYMPGGWSPIENVDGDFVVQEMANFAVETHNNNSPYGERLVYLRTVSAESQVVSGMNYRLLISAVPAATRPASARTYEAVVYDQPWTNTRKLTSFKLIA